MKRSAFNAVQRVYEKQIRQDSEHRTQEYPREAKYQRNSKQQLVVDPVFSYQSTLSTNEKQQQQQQLLFSRDSTVVVLLRRALISSECSPSFQADLVVWSHVPGLTWSVEARAKGEEEA